MKKDFKALGHQIKQPTKQLETFPKPKHVTEVEMESINFTSLCPITGQPDYGRIVIRYHPRELCLESKSLKLYLMTFRNRGSFCEALSTEIAEDLFKVLKPFYVRVVVIQSPRGDVAIESTSEIRS